MFWNKFGGTDETPGKVTGSVGLDDTGTTGGSSEAPVSEAPARTESIDQSGWKQEVEIDGAGIRVPRVPITILPKFSDKKWKV